MTQEERDKRWERIIFVVLVMWVCIVVLSRCAAVDVILDSFPPVENPSAQVEPGAARETPTPTLPPLMPPDDRIMIPTADGSDCFDSCGGCDPRIYRCLRVNSEPGELIRWEQDHVNRSFWATESQTHLRVTLHTRIDSDGIARPCSIGEVVVKRENGDSGLYVSYKDYGPCGL